MAEPTLATRRAVYARDGYRCVTCDTPDYLTFQHRRRVGMGGTRNQPAPVDGLTACVTCNERYEHDLQTVALAYGWKAKSWTVPDMVPVYFPGCLSWFRLEGVNRYRITQAVAIEMMHAVYGAEWDTWWREVNA